MSSARFASACSRPRPVGSRRQSGSLAGLFYGGGTQQLITQLTGVVACAIFVLTTSAIAWFVLKYTMGIRVSPEEEMQGLDIGEHGNEAYPNFVKSGNTMAGF